MSPRTGRPTDSKKDFKLQIRLDKDTLERLDECARRDNTNRSEIVRKGIDLVEKEQKK